MWKVSLVVMNPQIRHAAVSLSSTKFFSLPISRLSPKSNRGFICDWLWIKPSCKSTITMKEALLRFTVVLFSGKQIFNGVKGHVYASIKISIFKPLRSLDTTWNSAHCITRASTHENEHWDHCLCTQSLLKRGFLDNSGTPPSWQKKSVDPWVCPNRQAWGAVHHYSLTC